MGNIKEKLSEPLSQILIFALLFMMSFVGIVLTVRDDKVRNTPDTTDPRTYGTVTSIASSYTVPAAKGEVKEYYTVTVDFSTEDGTEYTNVFVYNVPFAVNTGDRLYIEYDETQPNICSVVDDPPVQYHSLLYIFFAALGIFSIFGFALAVRRSNLQRIKKEVDRKNAELSDLENVKEGYGSYDGTGKINLDAAPFSDRIDYNQIYDENQGVMDSFYDPTAPYMGYDDSTDGQPPAQEFYAPGTQPQSYAEKFEPYKGYEEPDEHLL